MGRQPRPPDLRVTSAGLPLQVCKLRAGGWRAQSTKPEFAKSRGFVSFAIFVASCVLTSIQLDDQLFLHGQVDLLTCRHGADLGRQRRRVELQPLRHASTLHLFKCVQDCGRLLAGLPHRNDVTRLDRERRDVHLPAVDREVSVPHQLAGLRARRRKAKAIRNVIQATLEQLQQRLTGDAARPLRLLEVAAELILEHAVDALHLLLLAQLHAVAGQLRLPGLAVLPGAKLRFSIAHFSV